MGRTTAANKEIKRRDIMLYVGIDIAKNKHDLACISDTGQILIKHFKFTNSHHGFSELKVRLNHLSSITTNILIALESTGHYNYNLVAFLRNLGYTIFSYNPLLIKEFAKDQSLRKTKTDVKDALLIAHCSLLIAHCSQTTI
ncbi:IS110 family transposase [Streptococcus pluranimalium]|uniref:IS110 family transposase n=1 Tax=Streptococcus pluranimalium TaxID=82348 RepID=UPI0039ED61F5